MSRKLTLILALVAAGALLISPAADAKHKKKGKPKQHNLSLTLVATSDATFTTSTGTVTGKGFGGAGTLAARATAPTYTTFAWKFKGGRVFGYQDTTKDGPTVGHLTSGTKKFKKLKPATIDIEPKSVSGRTVTTKVTGKVKY